MNVTFDMANLVNTCNKTWVYWKDLNSVYQGCNPTMAKALQLKSPEEIIGKTDYDLIPKSKEADFFRSCDQKVISSKAFAQFHDVATLSSSTIHFLAFKLPFIENCKVKGIIGISYYLTNGCVKDNFFLKEIVNKPPIHILKNEFSLTDREIQIIHLTTRGKTAKEIASNVNLSYRTVEHAIEKIKLKVGVSCKSDLIDKFFDYFI